MSCADYFEVIKQFPLFRDLSNRALRAADRNGEVDQITEFLQTLKAYSRAEWLRNIVQIRSTLFQFTSRRTFEKHSDTFRSLEHTSRAFMEEMCGFCDWNRESSWAVENDGCSVDEYQQLTVDAFDFLLKWTFQRALFVEHWTHKLSALCRTLCKLPRTMQIDISQLQFSGRDYFASGGYGSIYQATLLVDDEEKPSKEVAVKFMKYASKEAKPWTSLHDEALNLLNLEIPGLNSFIGVTTDPERGLGLVSPYLKHGNAVNYMSSRNMGTIERITWVCTIFPIVVSAIHKLHYLKLTHGDIKGANILIDDSGNPCLTDFGLARACSVTETNNWKSSSETGSYAFTLRFCSPERRRSNKLYTSKADDVWALGMTIVELLTGELPFPKMRDPQVEVGLYERSLVLKRSDVPEEVHEDLWEVIRGCTEINPWDRWSSFRVYTAMETIRGKYALGREERC